jgi:hypothetical protein
MFFDGLPGKGSCPADGFSHQSTGFNFAMPHDVPELLDFDFNPIVFGGGVPVGGNSHLTIRQDGSYSFSGHFHDSGATSHKVGMVWLITDSQNIAYGFSHSGHVAGTASFGDRNHDWKIDQGDGNIANNWAFIGGGSSSRGDAKADLDIQAIVDEVVQAVGVVEKLILVVG